MSQHRRAWLAVIPLLALLVGLGRNAEPETDLSQDEKTLREAKVDLTGPGLLQRFRSHTYTEADRKRVPQLLGQLGSDAFETREKASAELLALGRLAVPLLTRAKQDPDPEVRRRAEDCLQEILQGADIAQAIAAARLLAQRKPADTIPVLLAYLPFSPDPLVTETVVSTLEELRLRDGKLEPALVAALTDKDPARRAAAVQVVGKYAAEERPAVRRLLADPDVSVRLQAALTLTRAGDKTAVDVIIALLPDAPEERVWQLEDLLFTLAGEQPITATLSNGLDAANRRRCAEAWQQWWKTNQQQVDLAQVVREEREVGAKVVCELQGGAANGGRVLEYGPDDRIRWQFDNVAGPIDVQLLSNGRVLLSEINANRVTERDRTGKVYFEKKVLASPMASQRLANGNTFIATYHELLEVTRDGRTVYSYEKPDQRIYYAQKLRNGHILYVIAAGLVIELDRKGAEVRSVPAGDTSNWASVEPQPNGHFLVCRCSKHEVVEIDATGKVVWRAEAQWPTWAGKRANGRVMVACANSGQVLELDREGKVVWSQKLPGRPCRVRRY